jgi:hypothetical protein
MNARLNKQNVLRTSKKMLGLAGLASLALVCPGPTQAQSKPPQTETTAVGSAVPSPQTLPGAQAPGATPATKPLVAQNSPVRPSASKGQKEGITVHGHWTIEVRNPDGKVAAHREFENALVTTGNSSGASLLAAVLGRVVTPGSWQIRLADTSAENNEVIVNEPGSTALNICQSAIGGLAANGGAGSCSGTLSLAAPTISGGGGTLGTGAGLVGATLTLTGSGQVPQGFPSAIGFVQTVSWICTSSDPAAVPVNAGQSVLVTVAISFQ